MGRHVTWFEVIGKDGAKLSDFYSGIFGWSVDANNPMNYGMVDAGDAGIGGGLGQAPPGESGSLTFYVTVPDLNATLKDVESRGGKVIAPPMDVPNGPTIAKFADPDGNVVGLIKE